jgi:hypothetical protein
VTTTGTPEGQEPNTTETAPTTAPTGDAPKADPWEGLPDEWSWTKNAVETANREAASRRVALREAEDKLKDAKTPEEFNAVMTEYTTKAAELETALERERAARKHGLDDDVLEFITGKTPEEIEKQAAKLAGLKKPAGETPPKVITQPAPSGGVSPSNGAPKEDNGRDLWRQYKERR